MLGPHTHSMKAPVPDSRASDGHPSPSWKSWRGLLYVVARLVLARSAGLFRSPRVARAAAYLVLLVGLVVQAVLVLTVAYLVDLSVSLMDLWADLARKHLEITL